MAFDKKYQIVADDVLEKFSKEITEELSNYTASGVGDEVEEFLDLVKDSMEKYVPVDTGATKNSWFQEVTAEKGKVTGTFGHDREGQLDYVPFIYLGQHPEGGEINFRNGKEPFWLHKAVIENLDALKRKLSKKEGK